MFITKKKYHELEKKVADLEEQVQSQQEIIRKHIDYQDIESKELRGIFEEFKRNISQLLNY